MFARRFFQNINPAIAAIAMTPRATPTPIPALAPVDKPPPPLVDAAAVDEGVLVAEVDAGLDAAEPEVEVAVDVGAEEEEDVVVTASAM